MKTPPFVLALGVLAACADDAATSTVDTPTQMVLRSTPLMSLGGLDDRPQYSYSEVSAGAFVGPDRFVILDAKDHELKIYSIAGEHLRTFGQRGEGPGELGRLPVLLASADGTIRIWDGLQQRLTIFDDKGEYVSSVRPMEGLEIRFVRLAGALSDNRVIWKEPGQSRGADNAPTGEYRDTTFHVLRNADGVSDSLAWTLGTEAFRTEPDGNGEQLSTPLLFGRKGYAVAGGDRLIYGVSDEPLLRSKNPDGSDGPSYQWDMGLHPITAREIDSLRTESSDPWIKRQQTGGPQLRVMAGEQLLLIESAPARETRPHFTEVHVNGAGDVLVQRATDLFSTENEWVLFDRDGTLRGWFATPVEFQLLDFTSNKLLGYTLDDLDRPSVQVRALGTG